MEAISSLEPSQKAKRTLLVRFHHHLLPLKLALFCNDNKFPVKLRPDIGYFVKPLPINIEAFREKESHLPGMFEYVRRYENFVVCWAQIVSYSVTLFAHTLCKMKVKMSGEKWRFKFKFEI